MRTVFSGDVGLQHIKEEMLKILPKNSHLKLKENHPKNVVILATKEHHCLSDLLVRNEYKDLNFNILASNKEPQLPTTIVKKIWHSVSLYFGKKYHQRIT
jgi:formyltetrahydrofolate hydrolase